MQREIVPYGVLLVGEIQDIATGTIATYRHMSYMHVHVLIDTDTMPSWC